MMMIKLVTICLLALTGLAFGCAQSTEPDDAPKNEQPTVDDSPVQPGTPMNEEKIDIDLSLEPNTFNSRSMEKAVLTIRNNADARVNYGERFWIEVENGGKWQRSEELSAIGFTDVGIEMLEGGTNQMNVNLTPGSISYEPGNYRLAKKFNAGSSESTAYAEFTVE